MRRLVAGFLFGVFVVAPTWGQKKEVTFAHQDMMNPFRVAMDSQAVEKATGYKISWRKIGVGADVVRAMVSGDVQIGEAGSSPIAAGVSQGVPIELFWILEDIAAAEALVASNKSGITSVAGLKGKKIGVAFVSTSHFHLLFAMELAGLKPTDAEILNMRPPDIAAAWQRGDIDATFVWDPALALVKKTGKVLITSGDLSKKGKATFDGVIVNKEWAKQNKEFMVALVKVFAKFDANYRANGKSWTASGPEVTSIAKISGAKAEDVLGGVALYHFPTPQEQASAAWLGGGAKSSAAKALLETAIFLKAQGRIQNVKPMSDYASAVTAEYVNAAMK